MKPTARLLFLIFAACLTLSVAAAPEQPASQPPLPVARVSNPCGEKFGSAPSRSFSASHRLHGLQTRATGCARPLHSSNNQTDRDRASRGTGLQPSRPGSYLPGAGFYVETPTPIAEAFLCGRAWLVLQGETWFFHAEPELGLGTVAVHGLKSRATEERHEALSAT